jgi:hypothetical protein
MRSGELGSAFFSGETREDRPCAGAFDRSLFRRDLERAFVAAFSEPMPAGWRTLLAPLGGCEPDGREKAGDDRL